MFAKLLVVNAIFICISDIFILLVFSGKVTRQSGCAGFMHHV